MTSQTSTRAFARFSIGALVVTAALSLGWRVVRDAPRADLARSLAGRATDRGLDNLRRYLEQVHQLRVVTTSDQAAIGWNDGFSLARHGFWDHFVFHRFSFAARKNFGLPDVYRARARLSSAGVPIEVVDLVNLTRTAHGEENGLVIHGPFVAYLNRIDGLLRQVVLLDYRGEIPGTIAHLGAMAKFMGAVTNWQEVRDRRGVGRWIYEFVKAPAHASLSFEGAAPRLLLRTADKNTVVIDPFSGAVSGSGASGLTPIRPGPKPRQMVLDWVANTIRRFIGEKRFEWVKVFALAIKDRWKRLRNAVFGPGAPASDEVETSRVVRAQAKVDNLNVRFGQDPNWPPPPVVPILKSPRLRGEGQWVDIYDFDLRNPGAPPALLKTIVRPDPLRPHASVRMVLMDPRQVELHVVAGLKHPMSTTGIRGDGAIPRGRKTMSRLLAAFNGGFKTMHGAWGMMVKGKVIVPAKRGGATVVRLRSGRVALGTWNLPRGATYPGAVAFRQNLPPLIEKGVVNPTGLRKWGNTVTGMDGTRTYRSAVGITRFGHLMYAWGDDLSAETMAHAMVQAGCTYAVHLDMNYGHSRFEFYRVYDEQSIGRRHPKRKMYRHRELVFQAKKLSHAQISWLFPRYIHRDTRDFFYLTLRRIFPYEDPGAPAWSTKGLPLGFAQFPPLVVRAQVAVEGEDVLVFKIDAQRTRFRLRVGGDEALAALPNQAHVAGADVGRLAGTIGIGTPNEGLAPPGTRVGGDPLSRPRNSVMSLLIDRAGRLRIERWHSKLSKVFSLRQGLGLLQGGKPTEEVGAIRRSRRLMRGAIGLDRRGDVLYAVGRVDSPARLAVALRKSGALSALALGPGRADAHFVLYSGAKKKGQIEATDLATGKSRHLRGIPLGHNQTFLYLLPQAPKPNVITFGPEAADTRKADRQR